MFSFGSFCRSENVLDQTFEMIFYVVFIYLTFGLSKLWWTPAIRGRVQAIHNSIWNLHGLSMNLVLLFCHTYGWLKYLGGTLLMSLLWSFGEDCIDVFGNWDFNSLHMLVTLNLHHHGGIIALLYQQPEDAWLNALLFGHFWWIHSFSFLQIRGRIQEAWENITGCKCTEFEKGYACFSVMWAALYCYYMPIGFNYQGAAVFSMVVGRWLINDNYLNIPWMGYVETPGVMFFVICKSVGWKTAVAVVVAYGFYFWRRLLKTDNLVKPPRFFMTDKIRNFLDSYPRQEKSEDKIKAGIAWFDGTFKKGEYPVFRAIVESDEVKLKDLIDNGADPNEKERKFQSTPMHWISSGGHINCACVLLECGVSPFGKGVRKNARQWGQAHFLKFLDELTPLVWEALREETTMRHELQDEPGMTWEMANDLAKTKGGRLCTVKEAQKYLMGVPLVVDEPHWCATTDADGKQKWIQVGSKFSETGSVIDNKGDPDFWGNNLEDPTLLEFKWNRILLWKIDSAETASHPSGIQNGA